MTLPLRQLVARQARDGFRRHSIRASRRCISVEAHDETAVDAANPPPTKPGLAVKTVEESAQEYRDFQRQKSLLSSIGGERTPAYRPHTLVNNPPRPSEVTLELLLASQSHMGHATARWNPANSQYIFGIRDGTHIISLEVTAAHLRRAARVVHAVAENGGLILFVGTRKGQDRSVIKAAELAGGYHLFDRWVPGSLTNSHQILGRCRIMVVDEMDREQPGFDDQLMEVPPIKPDLVVCLNPLENATLLRECASMMIPTIGVIDTNADPLAVTYPIPANDDSLRCTNVIAGVLGRAGQEGRARRIARAENGQVTRTSIASLKPRR